MGAIYPAFNWLINEKFGGWLMHAGAHGGIGGSVAYFVYGMVNRPAHPLPAYTTCGTPYLGSS